MVTFQELTNLYYTINKENSIILSKQSVINYNFKYFKIVKSFKVY